MAKMLFLIRHGSMGLEHRHLLVGHTDAPLDDEGKRQAAAIAAAMGGEAKPDRIWTSPLVRARDTAQAMASSLSMPLEVMPDLREADFGLWEGLSFEEIASSFPAEVELWAKFDQEFRFPGGESLQGFLKRVGRVAEAIVQSEAERLAVVTHAGVIRSLLCQFLGLEPWQYVIFESSVGSISILRLFSQRGVLASWNHCPKLDDR